MVNWGVCSSNKSKTSTYTTLQCPYYDKKCCGKDNISAKFYRKLTVVLELTAFNPKIIHFSYSMLHALI